MADWGNYIIQGGLLKVAPDISTPLRALAYAVLPPTGGTLHAGSPFYSENQLAQGVIWPTALDGPLTIKGPSDEAPAGDWAIGTKFYFLVENDTGDQYKIIATLVTLSTANSQGLSPLTEGFFNLVLGTFNYLTYNLFEGNVGTWMTTSIEKISSTGTGGTGGGLGGFISDAESAFSRQADLAEAFIKEKKSMQNKQLINWLGLALLALGLGRKSNTIALSGGVMLAYNAINEPKKKGDIVISDGREMSVINP